MRISPTNGKFLPPLCKQPTGTNSPSKKQRHSGTAGLLYRRAPERWLRPSKLTNSKHQCNFFARDLSAKNRTLFAAHTKLSQSLVNFQKSFFSSYCSLLILLFQCFFFLFTAIIFPPNSIQLLPSSITSFRCITSITMKNLKYKSKKKERKKITDKK